MTQVLGLPSYLEGGKLISVEDDVQNVIRDMKSISDRLYCWFDQVSSEFHIVEHCLDGEDRLVLSTRELDQRVIQRLRVADHWHGHDTPRNVLGDDEDFAAQVDKANDEIRRRMSEETAGRVHEAGEAFAWAMDLCKDRSSVGGSISVPRGI